jgi:glycosyltransferase involved in cell wall biosynthesis
MVVAYFGQYIPLHGVPTILEAAAALREAPIDFLMVGRGQTLDAALAIAAAMNLKSVHFDTTWRSPAELAAEVLARADVCLGAFSTSAKAQRVVPFKVYAAMAAGRAVVTGDTPAVRELLRPRVEVEVVETGDAAALAATLRRLASSPEDRLRLSSASRAAYEARFSAPVLGRRLATLFAEAVAAREVGRSAVIPARASVS